MTPPEPPDTLASRYDALWDEAAPDVRRGRLTFDAWALRKADDARRSLTVLARLAPDVGSRLAAFGDELRALEPAQYYQPRADLHHTVLSLFTATAEYEPHLAHLAQYRAAVAEAVAGAGPFAIELRGVTLSRGAVLAQGFPQDDTLARVRERLRAALGARGLGDALDQRYRLVTAHVTLVRFSAPLADPGRFVDALAAARGRAFGTSPVTRLELVLGDWYQTSERGHAVAVYDLRPPDSGA